MQQKTTLDAETRSETNDRDKIWTSPRPFARGGGRRALIAGLLLPGGGQLVNGDLISALAVLSAVAFLWLCTLLEWVVPNYRAYPAPLSLLRAAQELTPPYIFLPQLVVVALFALTVHVGAATFAARDKNEA